MVETVQMGLPLLVASQAQKHVTVNEALARLDGLVPMVLASCSLAAPPLTVVEGTVYAVPAGAGGAWEGQEGALAIAANGGWIFAAPRRGWRAFLLDEGCPAVFDGAGWIAGAVTMGPGGAGLSLRVIEEDHAVAAGTSSTTGALIPANAVVFGVTARVTGAIGGSATGWSLGNPGAETRYGSGLGLAAGSWARGVLGQPTTFYAPTALQLTAEGGGFSGGSVRLAVHLLELNLPQG